MKCPNCGKEIADQSMFCEFCGMQVSKNRNWKPLSVTIIILVCISILAAVACYQYEEIQRERYDTQREIAAAEQRAKFAEQRANASEQQVREAAQRAKDAEQKAVVAEQKAKYAEQKAKAAAQKAKTDKSSNGNRSKISAIAKLKAKWATSNGIIQLDDSNYDEFIALSKQYPIMVDFYGDWCNPCKRMEPYIQRIQQKYADRILIGRYYVDFSSKEVKRIENNVSSIPTIFLIKNEKRQYYINGYKEESELNKYLEDFLSK